MKTLTKALLIFICLFFLSSLMVNILGTEFGNTDFFKNHGWFFLISISFFPRLTLLFSSVAFGGFLWWLGFFFFPRVLIASLATVAYFNTNPVLVVISWMIALSGEIFEKWGISRPRIMVKRYGGFQNTRESAASNIDPKDIIEGEFKVKE